MAAIQTGFCGYFIGLIGGDDSGNGENLGSPIPSFHGFAAAATSATDHWTASGVIPSSENAIWSLCQY